MLISFLLALVNFVLGAGFSFISNWLTARPWRKAKGAHWTEQARLLWPVRMASSYVIVLFPLSLILVEGKTTKLDEGFLAWLAGAAGVVLGTYPLYCEIYPDSTFREWSRLSVIGYVGRYSFWFCLLLGIVLMPSQPGVLMVALAAAVFGVWLASNFGLWIWILQRIGHLQSPDPRLWKIINETSKQAGQFTPVTWVLNSRTANAWALPLTGQLVFSRRALEIMSDEEVEAVALHELAHLSEPKSVIFFRAAVSLAFYPLIFTTPATASFGLWAFVGIAITIILLSKLRGPISRRMEKRADTFATTNQAEEGVYARALEKLYRENLIPAVLKKARTHPHLYDRMLTAGVIPEYPRPKIPAGAPLLTLLLWLAYGMLIVFCMGLRNSHAAPKPDYSYFPAPDLIASSSSQRA